MIETANLPHWIQTFEKQSANTGPVKCLHIMFNQMYISPFIAFINAAFPQENHQFVVFGGMPHKDLPPPPQENAYTLNSDTLAPVLDLIAPVAQKIVVHGLFFGEVMAYLLKRPELMAKCYWSVWGGDLYNDETHGPFYRHEKRRFAQGVQGLIVGPRGDFHFAKRLYRLRQKKGFQGLYVNPLGEKELAPYRPEKPLPRDPRRPVVIQINNSADPSIVEMLHQLHRFKDENIRVRLIISYGDQRQAMQALKLGRELFGRKLDPINRVVSPEAYARLLVSTDVLVMNQPRQQGLGNIYAMLYLGKKVFVRSDTTTWPCLKELYGVHLYDTLTIDTLSFEALVAQDIPVLEQNMKLIEPCFDLQHIRQLWEAVFQDEMESTT